MNSPSRLLPCPPTLLIQDLRSAHGLPPLHGLPQTPLAWRGKGGRGKPMLLRCSYPHREGAPQSSWGEDTVQYCECQGNKPSPPTRGQPPLTRWALHPTSRQFLSKWMEAFNHQNSTVVLLCHPLN